MTGVRAEVVEHANGILASNDLMEATVVDVEKHSVDEAVFLRHTAMKVAAQAKRMIEALDLHLCDVMELGDAVNHAGWCFRKGTKKERERFDHDGIRRRIRDRVLEVARDTEESEAWDLAPFLAGVRIGADVALRTMADIYLSDSTKAKTGQLDRYGIPRGRDQDGTVRHWEKGDPYIDVSPIQSQVQE